MRLIDADALGIGRCNPDAFYDEQYAIGWNSVISIIENAPTVDAEPVRHGKWIEKPYLIGKYLIVTSKYCSVCGENFGRKYKHCPNCGAKMMEKEKND